MPKQKSGGEKRKHPEKYRKQYYRTYQNKEKAWAKHLKKYPKDTVAKKNIDEARKKIKTQK